jgi:hypothetical protein
LSGFSAEVWDETVFKLEQSLDVPHLHGHYQ